MTDNERLQSIRDALNETPTRDSVYRDVIEFLLKQLDSRDETIERLFGDMHIMNDEGVGLQHQLAETRDEFNNCATELVRTQTENTMLVESLERLSVLCDKWSSIPYQNSFILTKDVATEVFRTVHETLSKLKGGGE